MYVNCFFLSLEPCKFSVLLSLLSDIQSTCSTYRPSYKCMLNSSPYLITLCIYRKLFFNSRFDGRMLTDKIVENVGMHWSEQAEQVPKSAKIPDHCSYLLVVH